KSLLKLSNKNKLLKKPDDMDNQIQRLNLGRRSGLDKAVCEITEIDLHLSTKSQAELANKILALLYTLIWVSRSATANTSVASGIKWNNHPHMTKSNNRITTQQNPPEESFLLKLIIKTMNPQTDPNSNSLKIQAL
ncbi:16138_t:CDS:1, partial [Acaulospora morrowiae]